MNCKKIIELYLRQNDFDGLFNPVGDCACKLDDLIPCSGCIEDCEPGYLHIPEKPDEDHEFYIHRTRPEVPNYESNLLFGDGEDGKVLGDVTVSRDEQFNTVIGKLFEQYRK